MRITALSLFVDGLRQFRGNARPGRGLSIPTVQGVAVNADLLCAADQVDELEHFLGVLEFRIPAIRTAARAMTSCGSAVRGSSTRSSTTRLRSRPAHCNSRSTSET
jgi:hypothetical protein